MTSLRALKSSALVLLPLFIPTLASAATDPCASDLHSDKCTQAVAALHQRTTAHAAGEIHAKSATHATRPLVETAPPTEIVPETDRIRSGEAHPVAARHEKQAH
jgi:hypothetical protein